MVDAAVPWYGGKGPMRSKILPLFPSHRGYIEVFGGGGWLLLGKRPAEVEVYNDLDKRLVNLYKVLANPEMFERFMRRVEALPYSRTLFLEYRKESETEEDPVERAAKWFVVAAQAFSGLPEAGWSVGVATSSKSNIALQPLNKCVQTWMSRVRRLPEIHQRLSGIIIENLDFREALKRYDGEDFLAYCDPPYHPDTRAKGATSVYKHEMRAWDWGDLVEILKKYKGAALLSGYQHRITDRLEQAGWDRIDFDVTCHTINTAIKGHRKEDDSKLHKRVECVWRNPKAIEGVKEATLFDMGLGGDKQHDLFG